MTNTPEEAAAARRAAHAEQHGSVPAPGGDDLQERSLGDVLNDPWVVGSALIAADHAVGAIKDKFMGSGDQAEPLPAQDEDK